MAARKDRNGHIVEPLPARAMSSPLGALAPPMLKTRDLTDEQLAAMNHADWLEDFAKVTLLPSPVPMTPRRLGVATRLRWAARYIKLLQTLIIKQEEELAELRAHDEGR